MVLGPKNHFKKRIFLDRDEQIKTFKEAIENLGKKEFNVLVYHGVAGIGKTSLREQFPKYLEEYNQDHRSLDIIWASIDFAFEEHRKISSFLMYLKTELQKKSNIKFPAFEIAHAIYWKKARPETALRKDDFLLFEGDKALDSFFELMVETPYFKLVPAVSRFFKKLPEYIEKWWKFEGERELSELVDKEPLVIESLLPYFWIKDLNNYLNQTSESSVIFIDTYDALWEKCSENDLSKDNWIREELVLRSPKRLIWVICGKEEIQWEKINEEWGKYITQHKVEKLLRDYCIQYLETYGITDENIQKVIFEGSEGVPFYLELSVETYEMITKEGRSPLPEDFGDNKRKIVDRFYSYLDEIRKKTFEVLSIPRFWNYELFEYLVTKNHINCSLNEFEDLRRFSFIDLLDDNKLQMHKLMQICLLNTQKKQKPDCVQKTHKAIFEFYSNKIKEIDIKTITPEHETALNEAFYHAKEVLEAEKLFNWFTSASDPFYNAAFWQFISPMYEEMQQILEINLGPDHSVVAAFLNRLAGLYEDMGEYEKALPLYQPKFDSIH